MATTAHRFEEQGDDGQPGGLLRACVTAAIGGLLVGVVGAGFRAALALLEPGHARFAQWAVSLGWWGWFLPVLVGGLAAGFARWMVRKQPLAGGSGVQHVEAVMRGEAEPAGIGMVPVKFFGGLAAIGSGLALGREGPTIQMGATIGADLARRLRCAREALAEVQAALGGAGLAVAFNAPLGGAMFVFEEVAKVFRLRLTIVTMLGCAAAISVSRLLLGDAPDFAVSADSGGSAAALPLFIVLGCLLGALGVLYNKLTVAGLDLVAALRGWPVELRAGAIGAIVGLVACFSPALVGGGDALTQAVLPGGLPVPTLLLILCVRWFLGPISYAAGTPGGIFSPLLLVGAVVGGLFAAGAEAILPGELLPPASAFAVAGMAAFFTGIVRAPITGVVLIAEMTATTAIIVPMLAAGFGAMATASLLRGEPIYDTLRRRLPGAVRDRSAR